MMDATWPDGGDDGNFLSQNQVVRCQQMDGVDGIGSEILVEGVVS